MKRRKKAPARKPARKAKAKPPAKRKRTIEQRITRASKKRGAFARAAKKFRERAPALPFHPLAGIFPLIKGPAFDELVADVKANGVRQPIWMLDGKILDGRNRYRAALAAKIELPAELLVQFDPARHGSPVAFVGSQNLHRRHLDESQKAMCAARLANLTEGRPSKTASIEAVSQEKAADLFQVGRASVQRAKEVIARGTPELVDAVDQGRLAVSAAAQATKLAPALQNQVAAEAESGRANVVRSVIKKETRKVREGELGAKQLALPDAKFGVILADPEWRFEPRSRETGLDRAADNHYPTSTTEAICQRASEVLSIAADDCVLFLWGAAPMLLDALRVVSAWGFTYKSHAVWVKERPGEMRGPGYWFTGEHELLIVATRGNVPCPAPGDNWRSVVIAPVGEHSEKPDWQYELIEAYFPTLPKIELNARRARKGWARWGLDAPEAAAEPPAAASDERGAAGAAPESGAPAATSHDDLEIPPFLRRADETAIVIPPSRKDRRAAQAAGEKPQ